eukprot:scaffold7558_cov28-Prasinocladus_malaysianus.AAC.1
MTIGAGGWTTGLNLQICRAPISSSIIMVVTIEMMPATMDDTPIINAYKHDFVRSCSYAY